MFLNKRAPRLSLTIALLCFTSAVFQRETLKEWRKIEIQSFRRNVLDIGEDAFLLPCWNWSGQNLISNNGGGGCEIMRRQGFFVLKIVS